MATTPYCTFAELSAQVDNLDATKYQDRLEDLILAVSEGIDNVCKRHDGFVADATASARTFTGSGINWQKIDECVAITTVAVKDSINSSTYTTWASTDWIAFGGSYKRPDFNVLLTNNPRPYTGLLIAINGTHSHFTSGLVNTSREGFPPRNQDYDFQNIGQPTIQVTAKWGYAVTVPNAIKQATIIQAAQFFQRGRTLWADALANSEFGEVRYIKETDPAYRHLIKHGFIRVGIG